MRPGTGCKDRECNCPSRRAPVLKIWRHLLDALGRLSSESPFRGRARFQEGDRVRLRRVVERYPFAAVGTVTRSEPDLLSVRLDAPVAGLEEWANEIWWEEADSPSEDLEVISGQE
jgi:hypothetical protein